MRVCITAAAVAALLLCASLACGSDVQVREASEASRVPAHPRVYLEYGFGNVLDGFSGTYTRDMVMAPDTTIAFSLPVADLRRILARADSIGFFSFPDTVEANPNLSMSPNSGPDMLRLAAGDRDHTVVWFYPMSQTWSHSRELLDLAKYIRGRIESAELYKALPRPYGSYE